MIHVKWRPGTIGESAADLCASALGAFILLVMILFPYYRNAGSADSWSDVEDLMLKRRMTQGEIDWLNNYHRQVAETVGPLLQGSDREWLEQATRAA